MSTVQKMGLEMIMIADDVNRSERDLEEFRLALVASGNFDPKDVYSDDEMEDIDEADTDLDNPDVEYDYSGVAWEGPNTADFEEFDRLQEQLANDSVILSQGEEPELVSGEWF